MHLIHPALVHFTVAFLVTGGLLEAAGILMGKEPRERAGAVLVLAGTLFLAPTVVAGFLAQNSVAGFNGGEAYVNLHERFGLVLLGLFAALAMWKGWYQGKLPADQKVLYAVLVLAGVVLTLATAWIGGHLVYGYGIGVTFG
jgi:uncharacterized membrane protein